MVTVESEEIPSTPVYIWNMVMVVRDPFYICICISGDKVRGTLSTPVDVSDMVMVKSGTPSTTVDVSDIVTVKSGTPSINVFDIYG